jgi:hypothetical protein
LTAVKKALRQVVFMGLLALAEARASERPIPPAFGPHIHPLAKDMMGAKSFRTGDRMLGAYYFYWYCYETKEHILNAENGSDGLQDHPPTFDDFCYKSMNWHKKQLKDMEEAGIDVALMVFWGAPSERAPKASLYWSYAGLGPMVEAREQLLKEGRNPPRIGLFYDTSTLQYNAWKVHVDMTTDYGKQWFYATIRDFYSAIPPKHWAMIDRKPIVLMYAAAFVKNHDQSFVRYTKEHFKQEFSGIEPYIAPQDSWNVTADNTCAWGGAFGLKNPGIAELGPGYNDSAVYGRKPLIQDRTGGRFYEENWLKLLRRPSDFAMIETWSELHEGTDICETKEYGRQYIDLTRKYAELFKAGWSPPWPKGPFTGAKSVEFTAGADRPGGIQLVIHEDGITDKQTVAASPAVVSKPSQGSGYIYFRVDDTFKWDGQMRLTAEVEYYDASPGWLGMEYDGSDSRAPVRGAYTRTTRIQLKGTHQWKKARFTLEKARLTNSENGGADLRIVSEAPEVAVRKVTLVR